MTEQSSSNRVLVCDDEKNMRRVLEDVLTDDGWMVETVGSGEEAIEKIASGSVYEAIVMDLSLPGLNGLEVLEKLRESGCESGVVVITAYGSVDAAVRAMQRGAVDFLIKPFDNARIRGALRRIRESSRLLGDVARVHPMVPASAAGSFEIVGEDPRLIDITKVLRRVAPLKTSVLIQGEPGTGKELVARAIHYNSNRRNHPFVTINCGALPESLLEAELFGEERSSVDPQAGLVRGKIELATGGTLFLEEVDALTPALQHKLLQLLALGAITRSGGQKEVVVDVRIIASAHRDLQGAIDQKLFREDLYYQLAIIPLYIPPLRDRREDIPALTDYYLGRFAKRHALKKLHLTQDHYDAMLRYSWPGNVRELVNCLEKAVVLQSADELLRLGERRNAGQPITPLANAAATDGDHYMVDLGEGGTIRDLGEVGADAQRAAVLRAIKLCGGNKSEAAKALGVSYKTLFNKLGE